MKKAIIYIRVSTQDQENSKEIQKERLISYCKFQNLEIEEMFIDENISGFTELKNRPAGSKALKCLEKGKASTIVAIKPDRLFRNTADALMTIDLWNEQGVDLHIIDMGGASFTTKTAIGRMVFTTLIAFAQFERDITAERTSAVLQAKKAAGKVYCRSILGFDKIGDQLIPNENEQKTIKAIMELSNSHNPNAIADILNEHGYTTKAGKPFYRATVNSIINNPIYKQAS